MSINGNGAGTLQLGGDLRVRRLGYSAMRLCGSGVWGEPEDPRAAESVLRWVVELGVNLIDTSDAYGSEVKEHQISGALQPERALLRAGSSRLAAREVSGNAPHSGNVVGRAPRRERRRSRSAPDA